MRARDIWIGWDDATRARQLVHVVSNSRFLLLPWIRIQNLASVTLGQALRRLPADWQAQYGVAPLLVETLVDPARYAGGCYRAANWVEVGGTAGRGRESTPSAPASGKRMLSIVTVMPWRGCGARLTAMEAVLGGPIAEPYVA
jgi:hypothetical protein